MPEFFSRGGTVVLATILAAHAPGAEISSGNRLANAQSPYLQQHADNPVDWYPWGDEAFEKAKREKKVVLLSIGYSTCHWCHVMNRESFSDPDIADYLNEHFVCIKVDREERPDIDQVYMTFVQQLTGTGGWPLNVWLTPNREPFFGGTYFPPDRKRGNVRATFPEALNRIHDMWTNDREGILKRGSEIVAILNQMAGSDDNEDPDTKLDESLIVPAIEGFNAAFNADTGAFGTGPNFPSGANLAFLIRSSALSSLDPKPATAAREMALASLDAIARGGINDHIGGGFHRYTVDREWRLPHFEKMLYDQATLVDAYLEAWKATRENRYRKAIIDTCSYLIRDMQAPSGGFYSAEDAESYESNESSQKREGAFYVWSLSQAEEALEESGLLDIASSYYGIHVNGNAPNVGSSSNELEGYNMLRIEKSIAELSKEFRIDESTVRNRVNAINRILFKIRSTRVRPHMDDKVITAWNGLAISALAKAGQVLDEDSYIDAARQAAEFVKNHLYLSETQQLVRLYRGAPSSVQAFTEDYAFLIGGLIDLYEATGEPTWLDWANSLQESQNRLFYDQENGGFFEFGKSEDIIFDRPKNGFDGATPSSNSVSVKNLARLSQFFDNEHYNAMALDTAKSFVPSLKKSPISMPALLDASLYVIRKPIQIVIASNGDSDEMESVANSILLPNRLLLHADSGASQDYLGQRLSFIKSAKPIGGVATAYVCEDFVCQLPARTPEALRSQLIELAK
jgi:uncharacterized protein YyaL (SSP411 family)